MAQVFRLKPRTIAELQECVEDVANTKEEEMLQEADKSIRKRCQKCLDVGGGHFESYL